MATCSSGHTSATDDYCDVCGAAIAEPATPAPVTPPAPAPETEETCAACGAPRVGRFCEDCGHDSLTPPPTPPQPGSARAGSPDLSYPRETLDAGAGGRTPGPATSANAAAARWHVTVEADRAHFDRVVEEAGPDATALAFPEFCPPRRFDLVGPQVTIGRRSRSRGIFPTVDLVGPPEDPGVSHSHALLVPTGDGWSVVDLGSTNGTTVNDEPDPLRPNTPRPLADGDRIHVGAWTTITLRRTP
ncbi:hypothetical protein GCM10010492_20340 [Saccharothrix mutabilis subsp. mutabilis]|uniref:FHA domain-containing protein n=1 Tax=Saccharothrix mutabilis subsp. mutabilis TaxID=66855 RepID=A0ABN0THV3_9PSEU